MTHDEMIAIIQAHKDGKEIQIKRLSEGGWYGRLSPAYTTRLDFTRYEYRIKPEPKVIWVNEYDDLMTGHNSESSAVDGVKCADGSNALDAVRIAVKYIEVIDE